MSRRITHDTQFIHSHIGIIILSNRPFSGVLPLTKNTHSLQIDYLATWAPWILYTSYLTLCLLVDSIQSCNDSSMTYASDMGFPPLLLLLWYCLYFLYLVIPSSSSLSRTLLCFSFFSHFLLLLASLLPLSYHLSSSLLLFSLLASSVLPPLLLYYYSHR